MTETGHRAGTGGLGSLTVAGEGTEETEGGGEGEVGKEIAAVD